MSTIIETIKYMRANGIKTDKVPEGVKEARLEICRKCDSFIKPTTQCNVCLCLLNIKTALVFDPVESVLQAKNVKVKCPRNKWAKYQVKTNQ